jgi:hypothetical protein
VGNTPNRRSRYRTRRIVREASWTGFEPLEHNMWTYEGQIEQMGRFARSVNNGHWNCADGRRVPSGGHHTACLS